MILEFADFGADDDGGVEAGLGEEEGDHGGGSGFAVGTGDSYGEVVLA